MVRYAGATWNINHVNERLDCLLTWLERTRRNVVALQELKTRDSIDAAVLALDEQLKQHVEFARSNRQLTVLLAEQQVRQAIAPNLRLFVAKTPDTAAAVATKRDTGPSSAASCALSR